MRKGTHRVQWEGDPIFGDDVEGMMTACGEGIGS